MTPEPPRITWPRICRPRIMLLTILSVLVAGCGSGESPPGQGGGHSQGRPGGHAREGGPPEQPAIPVAVAEVKTGSIASYFRATATLEAEKEAEVLARVSGLVERLHCEEGDVMGRGDPLVSIQNSEYRLRLEQAEATTANLRSRFERLEAMVNEQLVTEEEFQAARSDLASAEAEEGLARLNLSYTTVRAPFAGKVTRRLVDQGQNLSVNTPLVVMADFDPLLAKVHVPSREFGKLEPELPVDLVLDSDGKRLQGRIKLVSPIIDPTSGTIKITVEVPEYPAGTRPGDFAQVMIVTERHDGVLLAPRSAVLTDKGESVVMVALPTDGDMEKLTAERRIVEVGFLDESNAEITAGLSGGEMVVVKGQRSLKHGSPLKILVDDTGNPGS